MNKSFNFLFCEYKERRQNSYACQFEFKSVNDESVTKTISYNGDRENEGKVQYIQLNANKVWIIRNNSVVQW